MLALLSQLNKDHRHSGGAGVGRVVLPVSSRAGPMDTGHTGFSSTWAAENERDSAAAASSPPPYCGSRVGSGVLGVGPPVSGSQP
ncbi:hypothetical protein DIPPA_24679 [Diplonema papillatum]|nr:hypothetical protein DIPPA_24679 [Diplonema papillatum]